VDDSKPRRACVEFSVRGQPSDEDGLRAALMSITREHPIDIAWQRDNIYRRIRRLVAFDMDSTLIQHEVIDLLNRTRKLNIISLEDPIEFVHRSKTSQVIQRELGTHLPSFAEGVRAAMREDPDVILVGELRDAETISMAMTAAETGHLVLGTLHTTSATKTIDRIVDALPTDEREQTKSFLAQSLIAVITQILVKSPDQRARRAVCEIMVLTKAIGKLIMTDQSHQIPSQLQMGKEYGMQLLDQALLAAIEAKEVDPEHAYSYASDKRQFQRFVSDMTGAPAPEPVKA